MSMHLLAIYYTTNNLRKRKKSKKKVTLTPKLNKTKLQGIGNPIPSYTPPRTSNIPSKSDGIGNAFRKDDRDRLTVSKNYTIAPAYNKGAYQVIGKDNIKDIGR